MATIKVLFIPCDEYGMLEAEIREVENELGALQGLVGGYLETYPFGVTDDGREVLVVCDEEGKLKLHDLLETMNKESGSRSNDRFVSGFILGVAVMMECQSEIRELLSESEST